MPAIFEMKKARLSPALLRAMHSYYQSPAEGPEFVHGRWKRWIGRPAIQVLRIKKGRSFKGWMVFNPATSMIEEIIPVHGFDPGMIDALIVKESLVSAQVFEKDTEKLDFLLQYGFRPTRSFKENGRSFTHLELSTAVLLQKTEKQKPSRAYRKMEQVVVEKIREPWDQEEVRQGLARLIDKLGGLDTFVKKNQKVVIKPNIVSDHGLKNGTYRGGIVTDIKVVRGLVELLLPVAGKVIIAEGSSINRSETGKMFRHYGYDRLVVLDPKKVELVDLNSDPLIEKTVPAGKRMRTRKIPLTMEKADVIINLPVLKIHFAAGASLAIKNLQGAMPPIEKYMSHFFGLWQNLVNIHHLIKPQLTIIDGLTGQEDFGPISGTPKSMNLLIGGTNPVAVDATAMRIMGLEPTASPPVFLAHMQGLGPMEKEKIKVLGPKLSELRSPFKQPAIDLTGGEDLRVHDGGACSGCRGYLHFVLAKLRKPDPQHPGQRAIDRSLSCQANIFLGPLTTSAIDPAETNLFMGLCQQHQAGKGKHLPGCPPHAEVILNGIFSLFPDLEKPKYADETEEAKLGKMLEKVLKAGAKA